MLRKLLAPALAMMALAGCNPARSDLRQRADQVTTTVFNINNGSPRSGQRIEPKYCMLNSAIISRPVGERVVDSSLWDVADEQVVPPDLRRSLEANGLRVGVVTGDLPTDVLETFTSNPPQRETHWVHIGLPDGERSPIILNEAVDSITLLMNHGGKVDGRDYHDATGRLLVVPRHVGPHDMELRVVPEIQHGTKRRTISALEGGGQFAPQEFAIKDAQQEEILRELATTLELKPGQTLVVGCRASQARSLGTFLFLQPEPKSDRILQSILLIQPGPPREVTPALKMIEDPPSEPSETTAPPSPPSQASGGIAPLQAPMPAAGPAR